MLPARLIRIVPLLPVVILGLTALFGCDGNDSRANGAIDTPGAPAVQASAQRSSAGGFTGVFHSIRDGKRSVLNLTERGGKLNGLLDAANLTADVSGNHASGELRDAGTASRLGKVDLTLSGDELVLKLTAMDPLGGGWLELPPVTYRRGAPPPIDVSLDAQLPGRWRHSWSAGENAADGAAAGDVWLVLEADGSIEHGRSAASADAHAGQVRINTSAEDGFAGRWRTSDRTLHILASGRSQWFPFARYEVESDKLTLTYNDGTRQVFYRQ